jgi:hypothetical protein
MQQSVARTICATAALAALSLPEPAASTLQSGTLGDRAQKEFLADVLRAAGSSEPVQRTPELRPSLAAGR